LLSTGRHQFRWVPTPHLPHGWDAGMLFEDQTRTLFCSDLFHQFGDVPSITSDDVVGRYGDAIATMQAHPVLMDYMPFTPQTRSRLEGLAALQPQMLAVMHGSAFVGDGAAALRAAGDVMERTSVRARDR
jgi:flavorubredoxin